MKKILLIDDSDTYTWCLQKYLQHRGYPVKTACTLKEARTAIQEEMPLVVCCDLDLPDGSGMDFLDEVRAADKELPFILASCHDKDDYEQEAMRRGATLCMDKMKGLLLQDKLGAASIDSVKLSDAKEWALRMQEKGVAYNTICNSKRSLKAIFYMAVQDDCLRKNPFDFQINEVINDDTVPKVPLTPTQENELLDFMQNDPVYAKYRIAFIMSSFWLVCCPYYNTLFDVTTWATQPFLKISSCAMLSQRPGCSAHI